MTTDNIFADRRNKDPEQFHDCRRRSDFSNHVIDRRPWWLNVDYVAFHTTNFDKKHTARRLSE